MFRVTEGSDVEKYKMVDVQGHFEVFSTFFFFFSIGRHRVVVRTPCLISAVGNEICI